MRKLYLIFLVSLFIINAFSQPGKRGVLKAVLADSVDHTVVEAATISLIYLKDSSASAGMVTSRKNGEFIIRDILPGEYAGYITIAGYLPVVKNFTISKNNLLVNMDTLWLKRATKELKEVIVYSAPVVVKEDTVEYNADAFKAPPNSRLEELLRRLPGLKIARDGSLSFNGEPISQIMIDGKTFFFNDPKIAVKNLPADIFDKIQVVDQRSKENELRKINDGSNQKVLNLIIKRGRSKGLFGNISGGYGTNDRYMAQANANLFNNDSKLSFVGNANNINNAGFTGSGSFNSAKGGGINETNSVGADYKNVFGKAKKLSFSASYFYNGSSTLLQESAFRTTLLSDSSFYTNRELSNRDNNYNHRFHSEAEYKPDTLNYFRLAADHSINLSNAGPLSVIGISDGQIRAVNTSKQTDRDNNSGHNDGINLTYVHSFRRRGQFLSANFTFGNYYNQGFDYYTSFITYYVPLNTDTIRRKTSFSSGGSAGTLSVLYSHPFGNGVFAEAAFRRNESIYYDHRKTFDYDRGSATFDFSNAGLTSSTRNVSIADNYEGGIRLNKKRYNGYFGLNLQNPSQLNNTANKDSLIHTGQYYRNWQPKALFNYSISHLKKLNINYNGDSKQPSALLLSPLTDSTNRLNIRAGNPDLKPEYIHRVNISYSNRDYGRWAPSFNATYSSVINRIAILNLYEINGVQFSKPVNANGVYNAIASLSLNIPLTNKKINADFFISPAAAQDINQINNQKNYTRSLSLLQGMSFSYRGKIAEFSLTSSLGYSHITYSVQPSLNTNLPVIQLSGNTGIMLSHGWRININADFNQNNFAKDNYRKGIFLLNGDISKTFFKDKRAEFHLRGFDLLNQNQVISRTAAEYYIENTRMLSLRQYFMLSFNYSFSRFTTGKL